MLEICRANGIRTRETPVFAHELARADEVFLAGTTTEVLAVVRLDGRPVGDGRLGAVTRRLGELFYSFHEAH